MPWYLHLFWGLVVYQAATQLAHGIATAGEWVGKAILRREELHVLLQGDAAGARRR